MELKDGAFAALAFALILILLAYFTGGLLFYMAFLATAIFIAGDYLWLMLGTGSLKRRLSMATHLSRNELSPGASASYTIKAAYGGSPGLGISLVTMIDGSIETKPPGNKIDLRAGEESTLSTEVTPMRCGGFDVGHAKVIVSSILFRDTFLAGKDDPLKVRLSIGKSRLRPNVVFPAYHKYTRIYDSIIEKRSGSDFSGVREYSAGENVKHIDWALSARAGELMVREYEAERTLPVYVLIDASRPPLADGRTGTDFSIDMAMAFINRQLVEGDRLGLICFSRTGVLYHVKSGMGREHVNMLADVLSKLQPAEDEAITGCGPLVSVNELYDIGRIFERDAGVKTLTPIIAETLKEYALNARNDGFIQAILKVTQASKSPCQIKVVTGLSMGLPGFMNGVRLAKYYGHTVTVILNYYPAEGQNNGRSMELQAAVSKLRAQSIKVITPGRADMPESVLFEGRINSSKRSIRGWSNK